MRERARSHAPSEEFVDGTSCSSIQAKLDMSQEEPLFRDLARSAPVGKGDLDQRHVAAQMARHLQRHTLWEPRACEVHRKGRGGTMSRSEQLGFRAVGHLRFRRVPRGRRGT